MLSNLQKVTSAFWSISENPRRTLLLFQEFPRLVGIKAAIRRIFSSFMRKTLSLNVWFSFAKTEENINGFQSEISSLLYSRNVGKHFRSTWSAPFAGTKNCNTIIGSAVIVAVGLIKSLQKMCKQKHPSYKTFVLRQQLRRRLPLQVRRGLTSLFPRLRSIMADLI